jgi:hypothetical protein
MITLTIFFEEPFWVGVFERTEGEWLSTSRIVFGSEPTSRQVFQFLLSNYHSIRFSEPVKGTASLVNRKNPKRVQREIREALQQKGVSTRSQMAIQKERERVKVMRGKEQKVERETIDREKYRLKQQKKKEKHRGK